MLRESLRLITPAGGGFRITSEDIDISGYRFPVGTVVTADPRIGNAMSALFPETQSFAPSLGVPFVYPRKVGFQEGLASMDVQVCH